VPTVRRNGNGTVSNRNKSCVRALALGARVYSSSARGLPAERVVEDRPLLRRQRLVERLDSRLGRLQCIETRRQELLHPIHPVEQRRFGTRLQAAAKLAFLLFFSLRARLHLVP